MRENISLLGFSKGKSLIDGCPGCVVLSDEQQNSVAVLHVEEPGRDWWQKSYTLLVKQPSL